MINGEQVLCGNCGAELAARHPVSRAEIREALMTIKINLPNMTTSCLCLDEIDNIINALVSIGAVVVNDAPLVQGRES